MSYTAHTFTAAALPASWWDRLTCARANTALAHAYVASIRDEAPRLCGRRDEANRIIAACNQLMTAIEDVLVGGMDQGDLADYFDDLEYEIADEPDYGCEDDQFWRDSYHAEHAGMGSR